MDDDAFLVLARIDEGEEIDPPLAGRWLPALKTIRWISETQRGPVLTPAGREALDEFRLARR